MNNFEPQLYTKYWVLHIQGTQSDQGPPSDHIPVGKMAGTLY
jgi:hypothetical protein